MDKTSSTIWGRVSRTGEQRGRKGKEGGGSVGLKGAHQHFSQISHLESSGVPDWMGKQQSTHDETIVATVLTVEEAIAGLEEEQARLGMVVVGGDTEGSQTFSLPQQLLLSRVRPLVWRSLRDTTHIQ